MRILFTRFPLESRLGGAEVQTLSLMKGLRERGHNVAFLGSCPVLLEETKKLKIENVKLKIGPPPVTKKNALSFLWRRLWMKKKLHFQFSIFNFQFDAVCMLSISEKLLLTPYLHTQGIKVLWIEHDRVGRWLTGNPWLPKLRRLSAMATTIVVSDLSKKIYKDLGFQNVIAIPNGIDVSRLNANKQTSKPANKSTFHVGTLARLSRDKGVDVLIDAVKDLPDVKLTIVGTGPHTKKLASQLRSGDSRISATKLQSVEFEDHVEDLSAFYRSLDVFALPSREHDPFGLVAGEAMLMGIPVIVTDACGIAGYLDNGRDALVVPAGSIASLQEAIFVLKNNPEQRRKIATTGKATAERKFSMERMVHAYEALCSGTSKM